MMIINNKDFMKNLNKIVLSKKDSFEFCYRGFLIFIDIDRERDIINLKTKVFSEKTYIPYSVRNCVERVAEESVNKKLPSFLEIEENNYCVNLIQNVPGNGRMSLFKLIKLFIFVARSWAPILKKLASQDLLSV